MTRHVFLINKKWDDDHMTQVGPFIDRILQTHRGWNRRNVRFYSSGKHESPKGYNIQDDAISGLEDCAKERHRLPRSDGRDQISFVCLFAMDGYDQDLCPEIEDRMIGHIYGNVLLHGFHDLTFLNEVFFRHAQGSVLIECSNIHGASFPQNTVVDGFCFTRAMSIHNSNPDVAESNLCDEGEPHLASNIFETIDFTNCVNLDINMSGFEIWKSDEIAFKFHLLMRINQPDVAPKLARLYIITGNFEFWADVDMLCLDVIVDATFSQRSPLALSDSFLSTMLRLAPSRTRIILPRISEQHVHGFAMSLKSRPNPTNGELCDWTDKKDVCLQNNHI